MTHKDNEWVTKTKNKTSKHRPGIRTEPILPKTTVPFAKSWLRLCCTRQVILLLKGRGHVQQHQHDSQRTDFGNTSRSQQMYPAVLHLRIIWLIESNQSYLHSKPASKQRLLKTQNGSNLTWQWSWDGVLEGVTGHCHPPLARVLESGQVLTSLSFQITRRVFFYCKLSK